jgi:hypothetical protein
MNGLMMPLLQDAERHAYRGTRFVNARSVCALAGGALVWALLSVSSAFASATPVVDLGQAAGYAIISGASVANTGGSTVRGDIGAPATPSGFPPGVLVGSMQVGSADAAASADMLTAYNEVQSRTGGTALPALPGATLTPGLYTSGAAVAIPASAVVTLDGGGDPNAVFVIQVDGALSLGAGAQIKLTGDAQASDVFWQVNGAVSVGAGGDFTGTALASTTGTIGAGALINGRVLAETAVTLNDDEFYSAPPTVTLTGGGAVDINNSTPTISGTTNVGASGVVTVTVAGQTLTATPSTVDGSWSVTPTLLADGTYAVVASTSDGAGNVGSATQQLTIDTAPPLITLDGAPIVLTDNPTQLISGTTNAAPGTLVTVNVEPQTLTAVVNGTAITESVGAQTLTAVVQTTQTWNIAPAPMNEGLHTITASVTDPAGNTSTATEQLTVDTNAPVPIAATPTSPTPPVTIPVPPISTPASATVPGAPRAVSVSSHTLTAQHPVKLIFTLSQRGTVQLKLVEMVHGKAKAIGTVTIKNHKAGKLSYELTDRFAGHKLVKGSYQLKLQTIDGKRHSKTITEKVSVG